MAINDLYIETYKGLVNKKLENLGAVNILVGDNNTCKTSFLEAVLLAVNTNKEWTLVELITSKLGNTSNFEFTQLRGVEVTEAIDELSNSNLDEIEISISTSNGYKFNMVENKSEKLTGANFIINEKFFFDSKTNRMVKSLRSKRTNRVVFLRTNSHLKKMNYMSILSEKIMDDKYEILDLLKSFDENIIDIAFIASKYTNKAILKLKHEQNGWLNISCFGDGIKKVIDIIATIVSMKDGDVLLIDEIETSLHVSALETVFTWIVKVCKQRASQLFVTTHSREALKTLVNVDEKISTSIAVYKLENFDNDIHVERIGNETAKRILDKGGDLR